MIIRDSLITEQNRESVAEPLITEVQVQIVNYPRKTENEVNVAPQKDRLNSLDVYRGFTIIGMALADNLGSLDGSAWWLVHPDWNGFTCADLVFPAFLFIMGIAIPLAVSKNRSIKPKNIIRVFLLFAIGLFINLISQQFDFANLRILGILQRLAICYGIVLFIHWATDYGTNQLKRRVGGLVMVAVVILYVALMVSWEDTSIGCFRSNNLDPYCNFAGYVDRAVFTEAHIMEKTDPEGIISTFTAAFTTYVGYCFGLMLLALKGKQEKLIKYWLLFAFICLLPIYPCSLFMPFNKRLYTITFLFGVLSTSAVTLTLFLVVIDYLPKLNNNSGKFIKTITQPFTWLGLNPLAIFIVLQVLSCIMDGWIVIDGNTPFHIFYDACFSWMTPVIGTAVYALLYAIFYTIVAGILFKYKLFLRL